MASASMGATLRQIGRLFGAGNVGGLTDRQLLDRYLGRRDESAFAALVGRHGPMVLGVCRAVLKGSSEVEDAFQATFLVLDPQGRHDSRPGGAGRLVAQGGLPHCARGRCRGGPATGPGSARPGELAAMRSEIEEFPEELRQILHEEIERLPDHFRLPVVLCDLEGLSRLEAARQLRWTEGALRGRLARARARLRDRLTHRGITVSSGVLAAALCSEASASVPVGWVDALAHVAVSLPPGPIVAGGAISATAAHLARTALRTMLAAQVQHVATIGLILVALGLVAPHLIPAGLANAKDGDGGPAQVKPSAPAMERKPGKPAAAPVPPPQENAATQVDHRARPGASIRTASRSREPSSS